jgi:hypothetical protein
MSASPEILAILTTHRTFTPKQSSNPNPSLRESHDEKIQSAAGASNLLSYIRETE